jgi:hypothetical protein
MRLIELPVFTPKALDTTPMYVNPEQIFFISPTEVPSTVIDKDEKVLTKEGTVISGSGQVALLIDMKLPELLELLQLAGHECYTGAVKEEVTEDEVEPVKVDTKRVLKSLKV